MSTHTPTRVRIVTNGPNPRHVRVECECCGRTVKGIATVDVALRPMEMPRATFTSVDFAMDLPCEVAFPAAPKPVRWWRPWGDDFWGWVAKTPAACSVWLVAIAIYFGAMVQVGRPVGVMVGGFWFAMAMFIIHREWAES